MDFIKKFPKWSINDCPKHGPVYRTLKKCVEFKIYFSNIL